MIKRVDSVPSLGKVATSTKVATKMTSGTATVKCTGQMAAATRVNGSMVFSMGLAKWSSLMVESKRATLRIMSTANLLLMHRNSSN